MEKELTKVLARRWFDQQTEEVEDFVYKTLELILGHNAIYFIEATNDAMMHRGGRVSPTAMDGFVVTGDPREDELIAHAGLIWTLMNGAPWPEEVYQAHVQRLVDGGSGEASYLAARLWPAHDLIQKVTYRPLFYKMEHDQLDERDYRMVLEEALRSSEYPDWCEPSIIPDAVKYGYKNYISIFDDFILKYINKKGLSHPISALIDIWKIDKETIEIIKKDLSAHHCEKYRNQAIFLFYISLINYFKEGVVTIKNNLREEIIDIYKLTENIIENFFLEIKESKRQKDMVNYILIKYRDYIVRKINNKNKNNLNKDIFIKTAQIFTEYIKNGIEIKDIFYIGNFIIDLIENSKKIKEFKIKLEDWLDKQEESDQKKILNLKTYLRDISKSKNKSNGSLTKVDLRKIYKIFGNTPKEDIIKILSKNVDQNNYTALSEFIIRFFNEKFNNIKTKDIEIDIDIKKIINILRGSFVNLIVYEDSHNKDFFSQAGLFLYNIIRTGYFYNNNYCKYPEEWTKIADLMKLYLLWEKPSDERELNVLIEKIKYNNFLEKDEAYQCLIRITKILKHVGMKPEYISEVRSIIIKNIKNFEGKNLEGIFNLFNIKNKEYSIIM